LRFRLAVDESNWPLLAGGHYSKVVVKAGLTVLAKAFFLTGIRGTLKSF
jgi:hypothetical protein